MRSGSITGKRWSTNCRIGRGEVKMRWDRRFTIQTKEDLKELIDEAGFVPYFGNVIPGFSIEEHASPGVWFSGEEGLWEWKGPVIRETGCAYGKFFQHKAVYVSKEWFPDFANYRRDGYDFDSRFEDELASYKDKALYDLIEANGPILSKELKRLGNFRKDGNKGFESIIGRLMAQCYVVINDFVYLTDRYGQTYGWGVAEYATAEQQQGKGLRRKMYRREPKESYERILKHLRSVLPYADEKQIRRVLG